MKELELAKQYQIFRCISGSRGYGMSTPQSDTDVRGIFIAPPEYILGCMKTVEQVEVPGEDTVIYELAKFVRLAAQCSPNIIELLFTDDDSILFIDPAFETFRENRHLFLSKKAKFTFSGYAMAQMKRIKGHNKWISQPQPEKAPALLDFATLVLVSGDVIPGKAIKSYLNIFLVKVNATTFRVFSASNFSKPPLSADGTNIQYIDVDANRLSKGEDLKFYGTLIVQQEACRIQHRMWKDYWNWKKNRNPVRAELEKKYGLDCKHASHLIRLLRMAHEILKDGEVIVRRPDAQELLDIRDGKFSYDELVAEAERLDGELESLYESSLLPHSADMEAINDLYINVVRDYWKRVGLA